MTCALTYPLLQWGTQSDVVLIENDYVLINFIYENIFKKEEEKSTLTQGSG